MKTNNLDNVSLQQHGKDAYKLSCSIFGMIATIW